MKLNILLVDDNNTVRKLIAKQLRLWGYRVEEAANGKEALERLIQMAESENRPNIALLDWNMPELDGIALCQWIKSNQAYKKGPHLYVLFLTINEGSESETAAYRAGADGYIVKGSWEELEVKLNAVKDRIVEEAELRNKIASLQKDPTGVLVKREIIDRLGRRAAQADQSPLGIVMIDIDGFKEINDVHGHLVGDQILEAVGKRLQDSVRNGNVGRYGGDEFLIGLPGCDRETTEKRAHDIVARLTANPISTHSGDIRISICYGTAVNTDPVNLDSLIDMADKALYRQKRMRKAKAKIAGA
ncbi:MAG: diguanylate cyclase [Acidobacteriota bacterium]|jgi:two-component system chemotaxis response regulator CheY|nr:diguanylate cyclase [Acidobacteriota bacterium]